MRWLTVTDGQYRTMEEVVSPQYIIAQVNATLIRHGGSAASINVPSH